jgi:uncharacterized protein YuzE
MNPLVTVTVDVSVDAAYIALSKGAVAKTVPLNDLIQIDLDSMDMVVGIETLSIGAELPLQQLRDEFHVSSSVVDILYRLRPSVAFQLSRMQQASEGVSSQAGVEQMVGT